MLKKILISILLIFLIYTPLRNIIIVTNDKIFVYSPKEHQSHKRSFKHITSSDYKPYNDQFGYYFANKIIKKYYNYDFYSSPTFYSNPWENGVHILLDGFRANNFRVKNEYLIKNHNTLLDPEKKKLENGLNLEFNNTDSANIHGIFLDLINVNTETSIKFNNLDIAINKNDLKSCDLYGPTYDQAKIRIFYSFNHTIEKENTEKIKILRNCFYYEFKNSKQENYTIKLKKHNFVKSKNVNNFLLFGNYLPLAPYVILERSEINYNYFYAKFLEK